MKIVTVINPKGGSGKSTLSTQIAGYFASRGHKVMLGDADAQQSSKYWLSQRPPSLPLIKTWDYQADLVLTAKPPPEITRLVIDTPGALDGWRLREVVARSNLVVVPILPSAFDVQATKAFLTTLTNLTNGGKTQVAVIGKRIDARTLSGDKLKAFLATIDVPVIGYLRDTQYYLHMVEHGLSMFDISASKIEKDLVQWQSICAYLDNLGAQDLWPGLGIVWVKRGNHLKPSPALRTKVQT
jgi:chromosome partitioning protein